jgi:hypothetical protein
MPSRRRRTQFTLAGLVLSVTVLAIVLCFCTRWWARWRAVSILSEIATDYDYDWLTDPFGFVSFCDMPIGDGDLRELRSHLENHPNLVVLDLSGTNVTDIGLLQLTRLQNLRRLKLRRTEVTPEGIATLRNSLPNLDVVVN